jgi:hypothetical protein
MAVISRPAFGFVALSLRRNLRQQWRQQTRKPAKAAKLDSDRARVMRAPLSHFNKGFNMSTNESNRGFKMFLESHDRKAFIRSLFSAIKAALNAIAR